MRRRGLAMTVAAVAAACAALPAPAAAGVSVGHSAWEWGNPRPQGNTFLSIEFQDIFSLRGFAGGEFGTLLRTDDGGQSWIGLPTGITSPVSDIDVVDGDTVVIGGGCSLRRSDDAGDTFTRLPWTPRDVGCASQIASLAFPSADVGYVLTAEGVVLRSADGGRSWSRRTALPGTPATGGGQAAGRDIAFFSADVGLAVIGAGAGGAILRTTDGGASWTPVRPAPADINDIWLYPGLLDAFAVGNGGLVYRSTDGGQTWEERNVTVGTPPRNLASIDCADASTCIAAKQQGDELYRTSDGGTTWTPVTPSTERVFAVALASATRAVAVGAQGVTVLSDNAGETWTRIGDALAGRFHAVRASSSSLAFAIGDAGALARTTDSGATWSSASVPTSSALVDVSFPSAAVGYALDGAGTLFRTENGGASWAILDTGTRTLPRALLAVDEATVLLVGPRGVRRSTDAGQTFELVDDGVVRSRLALTAIDRAGTGVFVYDGNGRAAAMSLTNGRTWRRIPRLPTRAGAAEYDWVSPRIGYALERGRLFVTRNGGRRWSELATTGTERITRVAFSSLTEGYLVLDGFGEDFTSGYLLRTIDAGRTWRPQLIGQDPVSDIAAPGGGVDFLLAGTTSLLASSQVSPQDRDSALTLRPKRSRRARPRRTPRRRATVQVLGRLTPPEGGERIVVGSRPVRGRRWSRQVVTVASNGSFTVTRRITGPTIFVAQWQGDDDRRGAGSRPLVIAPR